MDLIDHPYWTIYSRLVALRKPSDLASARNFVLTLAKEARLSVVDQVLVQLLLAVPWFGVRMVEAIFFRVLREQYSYSVWSPAVLKTVANCAPLVKMGAGNGYNAYLLKQAGAEVVPIDAYPVEEGRNWFFNTRFGLPRPGGGFVEVLKGDPRDLELYDDHTLVLCWPPKNAMAARCLEHYRGEKLVLIAVKDCCADKAFYRKLETEWELEYRATTGSWDSCHTELMEIYKRKDGR